MAEVWHAFYFEDMSPSAAPSRTAVIEAHDEAEATQIALGKMGSAKRVNVERPIWAQPHLSISTFRPRRDPTTLH